MHLERRLAVQGALVRENAPWFKYGRSGPCGAVRLPQRLPVYCLLWPLRMHPLNIIVAGVPAQGQSRQASLEDWRWARWRQGRHDPTTGRVLTIMVPGPHMWWKKTCRPHHRRVRVAGLNARMSGTATAMCRAGSASAVELLSSTQPRLAQGFASQVRSK